MTKPPELVPWLLVGLLVGCVAAAGDPGAAPLVGRTWTLVWLLEEPVAPGENEPAPTLWLEPDGRRASGSGGCNHFTGSYEVDGEKLHIGPLATTRRACGRDMVRERLYFEVLPDVTRWRIREGRLELEDAAGRVVARLRADP